MIFHRKIKEKLIFLAVKLTRLAIWANPPDDRASQKLEITQTRELS